MMNSKMSLHSVDNIKDLFSASANERFRSIAKSNPDKLAVKVPGQEVSYSELLRFSESIANLIQNIPDNSNNNQQYVALLFEHGIDMITALLGVLLCGKAYLPLDAAYPVSRLKYMFSAAGNPLIITNKKNYELAKNISEANIIVLDEMSDENITVNASPDPYVQSNSHTNLDNPAYLLFTSGSTGEPKGVSQTQRNLLYHTWVWVKRLSITDNDRLSLQSAYSWDSSVQDIFSSLLCGATLYPFSLKEMALTHAIDWLQNEAVSVYHSTLPIFRNVTKIIEASNYALPALRMLALGGDSVYLSDINKFKNLFAPSCQLAYAYGATESSSALMKVIDQQYDSERNSLALGTPDENIEVYLKQSNHKSNLGSEQGEIVLKSAFICPGYLSLMKNGEVARIQTPAFTQDTTDDNVFHYHTGDIGQILPNGDIGLIGRKDNKIKVSGMRIEQQEVEGALNMLLEVEQAAIKAFQDDQHNTYIAAYIVLGKNQKNTTSNQIRALLKEKLPEYAIPSRFIFLRNLPLTPNGKLDRSALIVPDSERPELSTAYIPPSSELHQTIEKIWSEMLGISKIGINDNFFDLGGQSILMVQAHAQLEILFNQKIPLVKLYANPTIVSIANYLQKGNETSHIFSQASRRSEIRKKRTRRKFN